MERKHRIIHYRNHTSLRLLQITHCLRWLRVMVYLVHQGGWGCTDSIIRTFSFFLFSNVTTNSLKSLELSQMCIFQTMKDKVFLCAFLRIGPIPFNLLFRAFVLLPFALKRRTLSQKEPSLVTDIFKCAQDFSHLRKFLSPINMSGSAIELVPFLFQYVSLLRPPITESTAPGAEIIDKVEWKQVMLKANQSIPCNPVVFEAE